ncbi:MAG: ABC transporter permease [Thermotogota bacterium]
MKIFKLSIFEIKKIFRNPGMLILIIILPIVIAYLGASFYPDNIIGDYKIGVYNEDDSFLGKFGFMFLRQFLKWDNAVEIKSEEQLNDFVAKKDYDSILIIPEGFMESLRNYEENELYIIPNPDNLQDSFSIYSIVDALFRELSGIPELSSGSTVNFLLQGGISVDENRKKPNIKLLIPQVGSSELKLSQNNNLGFKDIFSPVVTIIMVLLFSMIGIGNSISQTKENGLFDIYRANGLKIFEFIGFKFIAYFIIGLIASLYSWYIYRLFGVSSVTPEINIILIVALNVFTYTSLGILVASITNNSKATSFFLTSLTGGLVLFGDILIPVPKDSLVFNISNFLPIKYSIESWRKLSILGYSINNISYEIYMLFIFGATFLLFSYLLMLLKNKR